MAREFAIHAYLTIFKLLFSIFNRSVTENKTTFIATFGGNIKVMMKELEQSDPKMQLIVLKAADCHTTFDNDKHTVLEISPKHVIQFIKSIYHLATSSHVMVDNYYGFLAATEFKAEVKCVQLWHAAGAIKQFGLEDLTNENRSKGALKRFKTVYKRFDHIVAGSDKMAEIFKNSFGITDNKIIRTGVPRTDFFYNELQKQRAEKRLLRYFPIIQDKKMLLYAPTFRDGVLTSTELHMDLDKMYEQFKYEYVLFLRLHPAVEGEFANKYPGFIFNVSSYPRINDLLIGADILITDYSSIPFEFSLLNKPMIFYAYDYEQYAVNRGVWKDYNEQVPGKVVCNTKELIRVIEGKEFLIELVRPFAQEWNKYSKGNAAKNLINVLYDPKTIKANKKVRENV